MVSRERWYLSISTGVSVTRVTRTEISALISSFIHIWCSYLINVCLNISSLSTQISRSTPGFDGVCIWRLGLKLFRSEVQRLKKMDSQKPGLFQQRWEIKNLIGFLPGFDRKRENDNTWASCFSCCMQSIVGAGFPPPKPEGEIGGVN